MYECVHVHVHVCIPTVEGNKSQYIYIFKKNTDIKDTVK